MVDASYTMSTCLTHSACWVLLQVRLFKSQFRMLITGTPLQVPQSCSLEHCDHRSLARFKGGK